MHTITCALLPPAISAADLDDRGVCRPCCGGDGGGVSCWSCGAALAGGRSVGEHCSDAPEHDRRSDSNEVELGWRCRRSDCSECSGCSGGSCGSDEGELGVGRCCRRSGMVRPALNVGASLPGGTWHRSLDSWRARSTEEECCVRRAVLSGRLKEGAEARSAAVGSIRAASGMGSALAEVAGGRAAPAGSWCWVRLSGLWCGCGISEPLRCPPAAACGSALSSTPP